MGAKIVKNYEVVARQAIKRGCPKSSILWGRLQNAPTK